MYIYVYILNIIIYNVIYNIISGRTSYVNVSKYPLKTTVLHHHGWWCLFHGTKRNEMQGYFTERTSMITERLNNRIFNTEQIHIDMYIYIYRYNYSYRTY